MQAQPTCPPSLNRRRSHPTLHVLFDPVGGCEVLEGLRRPVHPTCWLRFGGGATELAAHPKGTHPVSSTPCRTSSDRPAGLAEWTKRQPRQSWIDRPMGGRHSLFRPCRRKDDRQLLAVRGSSQKTAQGPVRLSQAIQGGNRGSAVWLDIPDRCTILRRTTLLFAAA